MPDDSNCSICLGATEDGVNLCVDKDHEMFCKVCISSYIENAITSCAFGACPSIFCPSLVHQVRKETKSLSEDRWKDLISDITMEKYNSLANSLLLFRCGSCHTTNTLDVKYDANSKGIIHQKVADSATDLTSLDLMSFAFDLDVKTYCAGDKLVDEFYQLIITKYFPKLNVASNEDSWAIFVHILKIISDTERRVNLHLRYLRDRPKMKTICCNSNHCFKCTTVGHHDGRSCIENEVNTDNCIVHCPACNISLVKGDGCDSVTCVCGKNFAWSSEKNSRVLAQSFFDTYPLDTSRHCVAILCGEPTHNLHQAATAWRTMNHIEVNGELAGWFRRKYAQCVAQCCLKASEMMLSSIQSEAANMCSHQMPTEIARARDQNAIAKRSYFETMCPIVEERNMAAYLVSHHVTKSPDALLVESASLWLSSHGADMEALLAAAELHTAQQFLYLYGRKSIQSSFGWLVAGSEEPRRMLQRYLKQMTRIQNRQGSIYTMWSPEVGGSPLQCDGDEWICLSGGDVEVATARYLSMEGAVSVVLNVTSITRYEKQDLSDLGVLTWEQLAVLLSWCRVHRVEEESDDYFSLLFNE